MIVKVSEKNYKCQACGAVSKIPIIDYTKCTCPNSLIWSDTLTDCVCPDPTIQIYSQNTCITCDATINAKDKKDATECNCLTSTLKWNKVVAACECSVANSIPIVSGGKVNCELCKSERIKGLLRVKGSIDQCTCPNNLVWDPITLSCICSSSHLTITAIILGNTFKCICGATSIQPYNDKPCITC